jgi:tryptophanyl-tRNA synthetase
MEVAMMYTTKIYQDLKNDLADSIEEMLKVPRGKLRDDTAYLESVANYGAARAQERSRATLHIFRKLVGLCQSIKKSQFVSINQL